MNKLEFIQTIRQLIAEGKTDDALTLMRTQASQFDTSLVTDATMLESRYTTAFNDFTSKGILPREDYDRTVAQINYALLEIIEKLEKSAPLSTSTVKNKNSGRILHNIPGIMPIGKERRCIVRIAYDDETLLRDMTADENTTIQSVRIAEVMGVELVDFNETPAFGIRTITEEEQFVSTDDYTQWLFMVKALREGKFPLTLKVAVIEEVNGKERKREIVLEKEIFIISNIEEPVPSAAPAAPVSMKTMPTQAAETQFEDSSIRFNYIVNEENAAVATSSSSKRFSMSGIMSTVGVIVMAMVGWVTFQTFNHSREGGDIVLNKDKGGTENRTQGNSPAIVTVDTASVVPNNKTPLQNQIAEGEPKNAPKSPTDTNNNNYEVHAVEQKHNSSANTEKTTNKKLIDANTQNIVKQKNVIKPKPQVKYVPPSKPAKKATEISTPPVTEPKIKLGDVKINYPSTITSDVPEQKTEQQTEEKTYRVRLVLKGEMKKAEISVDGQSVDKFLKKNIFGTPQYIEFKSSKIRHTITFKRGNISCSVTDVLIENGDLTVEPCSFD